MGKAVLLSIRPTWAQAIDRGIKTVEVRKKYPNIPVPFKVYLYCSSGKESLLCIIKDGDDCYGETYHGKPIFVTAPEGGYGSRISRQTVCGEFICDRVELLNNIVTDKEEKHTYHLPTTGNTCLTLDELERYGRGKPLFGWHIKEYKWYREPKRLEDFGRSRPPMSYCFVEEVGEE